MKELENKCLRFVLHYYQKDKLDTPKSLESIQREKPDLCTQTLLFPYFPVYIRSSCHNPAGSDSAYSAPSGFRTNRDYRTCPTGELSASGQFSPDLVPYSSVSFCKQTYQNDRREIQMKGKVAFTVRHDETRPFRVLGRLTQTVVLGTQFTVDESRQDTASVQVTTGKVRLISLQGTESVILTKGMTAQIVKGETKPRVISQKQKIRKGSFQFENTPLSQVLEQLSRYYQVRLTTQASDRRLTARFEERSLDEIIEIIEKVLKVKIRKEKP